METARSRGYAGLALVAVGLGVFAACGKTDDSAANGSNAAANAGSDAGPTDAGTGPETGISLDAGSDVELSYGPCPSTDGVSDAAVDAPFGDGDLTLLLVFDKSASMDFGWDGRTRWQAASEALVAGTAPYLDNLTIGAILFPQLELCGVAPLEHEVQIDYAPGRDFMDTWLDRSCKPKEAWGTPLERAMEYADDAIDDAVDLGLLSERFRVMVVTDGEPNCEDDPLQMAAYAERWKELGIETYVLGLPGSEMALELLDSIARAGGTEKAQLPGDPGELESSIAVIAK